LRRERHGDAADAETGQQRGDLVPGIVQPQQYGPGEGHKFDQPRNRHQKNPGSSKTFPFKVRTGALRHEVDHAHQ
jgi:hypothetical protein